MYSDFNRMASRCGRYEWHMKRVFVLLFVFLTVSHPVIASHQSTANNLISTVLLLQFTSIALGSSQRYLSESWAMLSGAGRTANRPRCVPIPNNLSLCYGIDYHEMRLPNLLEHESMDEVVQQSGSWLPLIRLNCHPDTRLFLCALFAPVCVSVDKSIPPCHSLCSAVQHGCEKRMRMYGFPWPDMLNCDRFPTNTDMCIQPRTQYLNNATCEVCSQVGTYENLIDHFCRSEVVLKVKLARISATTVWMRAGRSLKPAPGQMPEQRARSLYNRNNNAGVSQRLNRGLQKANVQGQAVHLSPDQRECDCEVHELAKREDRGKNRKRRYLLMANRDPTTGMLVADILMPWQKGKQFKRAIRTFRRIDCSSLGQVIRDRARRRQPVNVVYSGNDLNLY